MKSADAFSVGERDQQAERSGSMLRDPKEGCAAGWRRKTAFGRLFSPCDRSIPDEDHICARKLPACSMRNIYQ